MLGRRDEEQAIELLLTKVVAGHGQSLVVMGEPGVGKTALVETVLSSVPYVTVLRAAGVEPERDLPFAALQRLCSPIISRACVLPEPQRAALEVVLGLSAGGPPNQFLVGLAILGLLSAVGSGEPVVCVFDDAQWLDDASAQTLAFAARRLLAKRMALLFLCREEPRALAGLPAVVLEGLEKEAARALLRLTVPFPSDREVENRALAEARGNPRTLLQMSPTLTRGAVAAGYALPAAGLFPRDVDEVFRRRVARLAVDARAFLLVAAAEPLGNPVLVQRAAEALGLGPWAGKAQDWGGVLEIGSRVAFCAPSIRSYIYWSAEPGDRRRVHAALAAVTDAQADPDRRAWHLGEASPGPDESIAAELERSASRARSRNGATAAAACLERAAALTLDHKLQARRRLAAAEAKHHAGEHLAALGMITAAETGTLDQAQQAHAALLRVQVSCTQEQPGNATRLLLRVARELETSDKRRARDTYLEALMGGRFAGHLVFSVPEAAKAALSAPSTVSPTIVDLLLDGLATAQVLGYAQALPNLKRAVDESAKSFAVPQEQLRWLSPAAQAALLVWDQDGHDALSSRYLNLSRDTGTFAAMPAALSSRIIARILAGELAAAEGLVAEMRATAKAMVLPVPADGPLLVAAWRGSETGPYAASESSMPRPPGGGPPENTLSSYAWAILYNSARRFDEALNSAMAVVSLGDRGSIVYGWALLELVEAAARSGVPGLASDAHRQLAEISRISGSDWAAGAEATARALLGADNQAERGFRDALDRLGRTTARPHLARAHLLFGEWLYQQGRHPEARLELRVALQMTETIGMGAFTERARRQLVAMGDRVPRPSTEVRTALTTQELQIAGLAAGGGTNSEIGSQLFLSARTVEWHLRKVFTKLGITSRRQLRTALRQVEGQRNS